jgi:serine/threonine protein kinase
VCAGTYELLLELASGGMATVFLARQTAPGAQPSPLVALKRPHRHLAKDKAFLSMLLDEARLASAIDHPNVVKVRELGFERGEPFIVLDYVEGSSLSELRKELAAAERAVDTKVAVRVVLDALAGLHAAHELTDEMGRSLGIIHRDVSPHNILLACDGKVKLTDFGIAKAEDRMQETRTNEVKGKLAYLAPERVDRRRICTRQSDIFSMAVVLWECLAGRRLFRGAEAGDTLNEVMHAPIPSLRQIGAHVPHALDEAIMRGLSRDLAGRYETAAEFANAIEEGARPENVGSGADVSRVLEAVFGTRICFRHQAIRKAIGEAAAERLLVATGLTPRPEPNTYTALSTPMLDMEIAPPAPSDRYAFGNLHDAPPLDSRRRPWKMAAAIGGGGVVGALAVGLLFVRMKGTEPETINPVAPRVVASLAPPPPAATQAESVASAMDPAPEPAASERTKPKFVPAVARPVVGTKRNGFTKLK